MEHVDYGVCDMCGRVADVQKKYYFFNIDCKCHSRGHYEVIDYCSDCVPMRPLDTEIILHDKKDDCNKNIVIDCDLLELILDARPF